MIFCVNWSEGYYTAKNGWKNPRKSITLFDRRFLQEGQIGSPSSFLVFDSFVFIAVEEPPLVDGV
jgi:hypothetical protein